VSCGAHFWRSKLQTTRASGYNLLRPPRRRVRKCQWWCWLEVVGHYFRRRADVAEAEDVSKFMEHQVVGELRMRLEGCVHVIVEENDATRVVSASGIDNRHRHRVYILLSEQLIGAYPSEDDWRDGTRCVVVAEMRWSACVNPAERQPVILCAIVVSRATTAPHSWRVSHVQ